MEFLKYTNSNRQGGFMAHFIIPTIFSLIMIVSGFLSWNCPLSWENRDSHSYPHYDGKPALQNADIWNISQILYGKVQFTLGLIHVLLEFPEVMLMNELCRHWSSEDVTIPALLCLCLPGIAMISLGNIITTLHLKKISK